jgi:hypothetical protein
MHKLTRTLTVIYKNKILRAHLINYNLFHIFSSKTSDHLSQDLHIYIKHKRDI